MAKKQKRVYKSYIKKVKNPFGGHDYVVYLRYNHDKRTKHMFSCPTKKLAKEIAEGKKAPKKYFVY